MKLYIAASSRDTERVEDVLAWVAAFKSQLRAPEHIEITHNWLQQIVDRGDANPIDATFSERASYAFGDLQGVREADVVWLLMPRAEMHSVGCYWEAGYADALGKDIFISGPDQLRTIFTTRGRSYDTDWAAFEALKDVVYSDALYKGPDGLAGTWY